MQNMTVRNYFRSPIETKSDAVSVTVYSSELVAACQEAERNLLYVLPLAIEGSSSYGINSKTNTLMLLFNVTYVESAEDEKGPEYVPDPGRRTGFEVS